MNITELVREAGIYDGREGLMWCSKEQLERFADLVVAHERNKYLDKLAEAIDLSVKAEREACANVCLKTGIKHPQQTGQEACAAEIRARGEK